MVVAEMKKKHAVCPTKQWSVLPITRTVVVQTVLWQRTVTAIKSAVLGAPANRSRCRDRIPHPAVQCLGRVRHPTWPGARPTAARSVAQPWPTRKRPSDDPSDSIKIGSAAPPAYLRAASRPCSRRFSNSCAPTAAVSSGGGGGEVVPFMHKHHTLVGTDSIFQSLA